MFMPAVASPGPPFTLDFLQLLRILLMDPLVRRAIVLIIVIAVSAAILAGKLFVPADD